MAKTLLAVARHEAAHAVIGQHFGCKAKWIKADKPGQSFCQFGAMPCGPVSHGIIMMAGSVAEHLWHGTPKGLASAHDFTVMRKCGFKGEDFRVLWEEASRLVRRNKKKIWRLAKRVHGKGRVVL